MSLRRIDLRFALPHEVRRAAVVGLEDWSSGLDEAGVELGGEGDLDLAVAPVERADEVLGLGARAVVLEGRRGAQKLRRAGHAATRFLPLPSIEAPDLVLPLEHDEAVTYALTTWRPAETWPKQMRNRALASLARFAPDPRPLQALGLPEPGPPATLAAAAPSGVPADAGWFLTLGQGDDLTRAVFHVFARGSRSPGWVVKTARVPGYEEPFAKDEAGLALVEAAGGVALRHAPRLLGRFEVERRHASVESAAVGERLSTLLARDRPRGREAFTDLTTWVSDVGRQTATAGALTEEVGRLEREVLPPWKASPSLVSGLDGLPAVLQHNDLGTWNAVWAAAGVFTVLDWESARGNGLPLWDLLYFSVDALGLLDRARTAEERAEHAIRLLRGELPASQTLFETIRRYVSELEIHPESVGSLATLCWLHHGLSHVKRSERLGAEAQIPPAERIAPIWLEDPLLGHRWDRWRG